MDTVISDQFFDKKDRARFFEATALRHSVRAFAGEPDMEAVSQMRAFWDEKSFPGVRLELLPASDSCFFSAPVVGSIIGCRLCAALICDGSVPNARLYAGMAGEAFVLDAVSRGMGTCWVAGTFRRKRLCPDMDESERLAAVIAFGPPAEKTETPRKRLKLTDICRGDPASWPIWAFQAAECVRNAPSALNRQPWRLAYAGRTLILSRTALADDLSLGIALMHMTLGLEEKPHQMTFGTGREVAALIAEDRA